MKTTCALLMALALAACGQPEKTEDNRSGKKPTDNPPTDQVPNDDDPKPDDRTGDQIDPNDPDVNQGEPVVDAAAKALVGSWMSDCVDLDKDSNKPTAERESVASKVAFLADGTFKVFAYKFEKTHDCAGMDFESSKFKYISRVKGTYKVGSSAASPEGAIEVNYSVGEIALAPLTGGAKLKLNGSGGFCGITGWEMPTDGVPNFKNITGATNCKFDDDMDPVNMLKANDIIEDIFKVSGDSLNLGIHYNDDLSTNQSRPEKFNDYIYRRQ